MTTSTDLITMIGNLSRSLFPLQRLISGFAYLLGIAFFMIALSKLKKVSESRGRSQESMFTPLAYMLGGAALIFLPTMVRTLSNTTFGVGNILQYSKYSPYDFYSSMRVLIQTAGILWFIRGTVLLVGSSQPGAKHGPKGLAFLFAGVLAMNIQNTINVLNSAMAYLASVTLSMRGG
jgi:hypothetical protein